MAAQIQLPPTKKARTDPKAFLTANGNGNAESYLKHLFVHGFASDTNNSQDGVTNQFYTLRLEHREGGPLAKYRNEERILLFRSDQRACCGKIIYSSEIPSTHHDKDALSSSPLVAHAKIHVLDVKSQYRGRDLGGLLFSEVIDSLRKRYCMDDDDDDDCDTKKGTVCNTKQIYDVECKLDAEEDIGRYGKLVAFYEQLGCRLISTRVQYVNNNDSETYRKIPMQIDIHPSKAKANSQSKQERARARRQRFSHLADQKNSFLPVHLIGHMGRGRLSVHSHNDCQDLMKLDWLISESGLGIQFCSTKGHLLMASKGGFVSVFSPGEQDDDSDLDIDTKELIKWTHFIPCRISDDEDNAEGNNAPPSTELSGRNLWMLRTCHGTFLSADPLRQTLSCTRQPSFWQANGTTLSLMCTSDTPRRRQHYRKGYKFQTYDYVSSMRSRFLNFTLAKASLHEALGYIHAFPAHPFEARSSDDTLSDSQNDFSPSLRTLCFFMAEVARKDGLPDWVQFIALIHELGEAVKICDPSRTGQMAESMYDWTKSSRSRVVGCKIPEMATFREFRHLNTDEDDLRYNSDMGVYQEHCGLENVFLMWSGCEYMYNLLRHNNVSLPEEAFAILRYYPLGDWHEHHKYSSITNDADEDMLPFVQEFDALRRKVRIKCVDCGGDLTDDEISFLWDSHYAKIATKYNCDRILNW